MVTPTASGADVYNLKLSDERADSVRSFLTRQSIPPDNVTAQGFGKQHRSHCADKENFTRLWLHSHSPSTLQGVGRCNCMSLGENGGPDL